MNDTPQQVVLSKEAYDQLCQEALAALDVPQDLIEKVTDSLYWCDIHGINSHGLNMLPAYQHRLQQGGIHPQARPDVLRRSGSLAQIDGKGGFGQVAGRTATDMAIEMAQEHGMGMVSVRNTNHGGALGYFTDHIASQGLIGFMAHNSNLTVAPFGGAEKALGTNPLSFAFPGPKFNVLVDLATSATAKGKIYQLARHSDTIPEGLALNKDGEPTTSAAEAIKGILLPLGGPKGYSLAIAVELLTGILAGGRYNYEISSLHHQPDDPMGVSMMVWALSVEDLLGAEAFEERLVHFTQWLKDTRTVKGVDEILMPGEHEARLAEKRRNDGISLPQSLYDEIKGFKEGHNS